MSGNNMYDKLFGWANGEPKEKPEPDAWVEPELPDFIPEYMQNEIKKTMFMDRKRTMDKARQRMAEQQRSHDMDAYGYSQMAMGQATGIGDAALLAQQRSSAQEQQMRMEEARNRMMQEKFAPSLWDEKMLEQYGQSVLRQSIAPGKVWGTQDMNGEYITDGVMRVKFPFGEIEMEIANDSDVERAFDMVKHMLKVHEENTAKNALKKSLTETPPMPDMVGQAEPAKQVRKRKTKQVFA